ncbi:hypothetical protein B0I37DRAFT_107467 [Chaetomium sp. MPI-CAGE-AT-0009]|nr:hypothetical protein B0I37DRAFT_107467 [Chaetomium sp. MPI-CAGE-AT-0009]
MHFPISLYTITLSYTIFALSRCLLCGVLSSQSVFPTKPRLNYRGQGDEHFEGSKGKSRTGTREGLTTGAATSHWSTAGGCGFFLVSLLVSRLVGWTDGGVDSGEHGGRGVNLARPSRIGRMAWG